MSGSVRKGSAYTSARRLLRCQTSGPPLRGVDPRFCGKRNLHARPEVDDRGLEEISGWSAVIREEVLALAAA